MMELFGNPGLRFFDAYREHFPLDGGYSARAQQLIERLLAHLR